MKEKNRRITVEITEDMRLALERLAAQMDRSMSWVARELMEIGLKKKEKCGDR